MNDIYDDLNILDQSTDDLDLIQNLKGTYKNYIHMDKSKIFEIEAIERVFGESVNIIINGLNLPKDDVNYLFFYHLPSNYTINDLCSTENVSVFKLKKNLMRHVNRPSENFSPNEFINRDKTIFETFYNSVWFYNDDEENVYLNFNFCKLNSERYEKGTMKMLKQSKFSKKIENEIFFICYFSLSPFFDDLSACKSKSSSSSKRSISISTRDLIDKLQLDNIKKTRQIENFEEQSKKQQQEFQQEINRQQQVINRQQQEIIRQQQEIIRRQQESDRQQQEFNQQVLLLMKKMKNLELEPFKKK